MATAVSPSMVSGRVVASSSISPVSLTGYSRCQKLPSFSSYSTSASEMEVLQCGHQLTMRLPR